MSDIYLLRSNVSNNYVSQSSNLNLKNKRVYTRFLEYAIWFETKLAAKKYCLQKSEWIQKGTKWWHRGENKKYEKNRMPK